MHLVSGVDAIADTLGSLGDLIPDLIFGAEDDEFDDENRLSRPKEKDQVVVTGSRNTQIKKRGTPGPYSKPGPLASATISADDLADDDESLDWTKED